MKAALNILGNSGEIEVSKEDLEAIKQFFSDATPGFVKHRIGIRNDNAKGL